MAEQGKEVGMTTNCYVCGVELTAESQRPVFIVPHDDGQEWVTWICSSDDCMSDERISRSAADDERRWLFDRWFDEEQGELGPEE